MAEAKRIAVFYEGDDDKAVLEKLQAAKLLSPAHQIANRDKKFSGKSGLVDQLLPFISPVNGAAGSAIVLVDLDDLTVERTIAWFRGEIQSRIKNSIPPIILSEQLGGRLGHFKLAAGGRVGEAVLVPVGLPEDANLKSAYQIDRFAIDDYVIRLVGVKGVYEAVSDIKKVPFDVAMRKLTEVGELFRKNGIEVRTGKRYVQILRAVAALGPATATIVGSIVRGACAALQGEELRTLLSPLIDDLEQAERLLQPPPAPEPPGP